VCEDPTKPFDQGTVYNKLENIEQQLAAAMIRKELKLLTSNHCSLIWKYNHQLQFWLTTDVQDQAPQQEC